MPILLDLSQASSPRVAFKTWLAFGDLSLKEFAERTDFSVYAILKAFERGAASAELRQALLEAGLSEERCPSQSRGPGRPAKG